jgi:DNA polymerase-4
LKLKTADFRIRTRATSLSDATFLADIIHSAALPLLRREADGTRFRLLGTGIANLSAVGPNDELVSLDTVASARARAERAVDRIREKFGRSAVERGLVFKPPGGDD